MLNEPEPTPIAGVMVAECVPFCDDRGAFARLYCAETFGHRDRLIVQINHSLTRSAGALRGLHFQHPPHAEGKWVRCLKGRVFDVAVDLRQGSPTFLQHVSVELSRKGMNAIYIPEGCAHGFQTLEADCELLYLHTAAYAPGHEGGLRWDDVMLGSAWPLPVAEISVRDAAHSLLTDEFQGIKI